MPISLRRYLRLPKFYIILLVCGLSILGLGLRLYDLTDQPIDFHPTRQLRGAIVARGMYYEMSPNADPQARQLAQAFSQSTGQYEPPILERIVAITYLLIGQEHFWIARLYNSLFWVIGGMALFALARRIASEKRSIPLSLVPISAAALSLAYYLVLPFSVQASRSFQPDPGMVVWIVLFAYALYRWSETNAVAQQNPASWRWAILSSIFAGIAVLTKAVAAYTVAGAAVALVLYQIFQPRFILKNVWNTLRNVQLWAMAVLMVTPTLIYYLGRGERASEYFSSWTLALSHLLLDPAFYLRWLNLVQELMGPIPLLLALAGVLLAAPRSRALLLGLWIGYIFYGLFLPYQMYTHSYYHLQVVPILALSLAPTAQWIIENILKLREREKPLVFWGVGAAAAALSLAVLTYTAWVSTVPMRAENYRNEPAYWQTIASYLPTDGKIMALTQDYGYRLMYYGWRKVILWPNRGEQKLNALRGSDKEFTQYFAKHTQDKNYFLITAFKQFDDQPELKQFLNDHYPILAEGQGYLIFDLRSDVLIGPDVP